MKKYLLWMITLGALAIYPTAAYEGGEEVEDGNAGIQAGDSDNKPDSEYVDHKPQNKMDEEPLETISSGDDNPPQKNPDEEPLPPSDEKDAEALLEEVGVSPEQRENKE